MRPWFKEEAVATNVANEVTLLETAQLKRHCATTVTRPATSLRTVTRKLFPALFVKRRLTEDVDPRVTEMIRIVTTVAKVGTLPKLAE